MLIQYQFQINSMLNCSLIFSFLQRTQSCSSFHSFMCCLRSQQALLGTPAELEQQPTAEAVAISISTYNICLTGSSNT